VNDSAAKDKEAAYEEALLDELCDLEEDGFEFDDPKLAESLRLLRAKKKAESC
jgi:hypothetical protein